MRTTPCTVVVMRTSSLLSQLQYHSNRNALNGQGEDMTKKEKAIFQQYRERASVEYRACLKANDTPEDALLASREKWQMLEDLYEDLNDEVSE